MGLNVLLGFVLPRFPFTHGRVERLVERMEVVSGV